MIAAGIALAATVAIAAAIISAHSGGPSAPSAKRSTQVDLPGTARDAAAEDGFLWVLTCARDCARQIPERIGRGALVKVDRRSREIVATTPVKDPGLLAIGEGGVWTVGFESGVLTRFDPLTANPLDTIRLTLPKPIAPTATMAFAFLPDAIVAGGGSVWVSTMREYVAQVEPEGAELVRMIPTPCSVEGMAVGGGSVWLAEGLAGLGRIDAATGRLEPPRKVEDATGRRLAIDQLTVADGSLWARGAWTVPVGSGYGPSPRGEPFALVRASLRTGEVERVTGFDDRPRSVEDMVEGSRPASGRDSPDGYELNLGTRKIVFAPRGGDEE